MRWRHQLGSSELCSAAEQRFGRCYYARLNDSAQKCARGSYAVICGRRTEVHHNSIPPVDHARGKSIRDAIRAHAEGFINVKADGKIRAGIDVNRRRSEQSDAGLLDDS